MLENLNKGKKMKSPQIRFYCESCNKSEYAFYTMPKDTYEIKIFPCSSCENKFSYFVPADNSEKGMEQFRKFFEVFKAVDA